MLIRKFVFKRKYLVDFKYFWVLKQLSQVLFIA